MDVYTVYAGAYTNLFEHYCPKAIILEFPLGFSDLMISVTSIQSYCRTDINSQKRFLVYIK